MEYEEVRYSRSRIEKVGKIIAKCDFDSDEYLDAIPVVDNWRAAHAFPLDQINMMISEILKGNDKVVVVQRLKRVESIIGKLQRENNTGLYRMQDLGGCRIIVRSLEELYDVVSRVRNGLLENNQEIYKETDYIKCPREISGYRSYHIVVKYHGDKRYEGMSIEIQIRTQIQHSWATAVEIIDTLMQETLKIGTGSVKYMHFFKLISALFSMYEGSAIVSGVPTDKRKLIDEIYIIDGQENIREKMSAYNSAISYVGSYPKPADYYLLITNIRNKTITSRSFDKSEIEKVMDLYQKLENNRKQNCTDVVLVSGKSFEDIRDSYPNYFMITLSFLKNISKLCKDYPEQTSIQFYPNKKGINLNELFKIEYLSPFFPKEVKVYIDGIGETEGDTVFCPEFSMTLEESYLRFLGIYLKNNKNHLKSMKLPIVNGPAVIIMRTGASFYVDNAKWKYLSQTPLAIVTCKSGVDEKKLKLLLGWLKSNICMWDILYNNHSNSAYYKETFENMCIPNVEEGTEQALLENIDDILESEKRFIAEYNRIEDEESEESSSFYELIGEFNKKIRKKLVKIEELYSEFYGLREEEYEAIKQDVNIKGYFVYNEKGKTCQK